MDPEDQEADMADQEWADRVDRVDPGWEGPGDRAGCTAGPECHRRHLIADGAAIAEDAVCRDASCMYWVPEV
ncbi:MAG: hypothetical protein LUE92_12440 [Clostridiales bacterium]|nr:hypothetical protein [Clostridiales bacterium]